MRRNIFKFCFGMLVTGSVLFPSVAFAQNSSLWKFTSSLLQPVVSTWNVYAPANLRFDGEIQPDGSTCAIGEILKKTGANDWDCAADSAGSGANSKFSTSSDSVSIEPNGGGGLIVHSSSTIALLNSTNSTSTNATTTSFAISNLTSELLKADALGVIREAIAGVDYLLSYDAWTHPSAGISATTSALLVNNATSTITNLVTVNSTSTNATTTNQTISSLSSAIVTVDALGITKEFAGTSCTNQFIRALSALGVATCESVDLAADVTGTLPVANGGTGQSSFGQGWLNSDGTTITSSTSPTVNYIVATSSNIASQFINASTTAFTSSDSLIVGTTSTSHTRKFVSSNTGGYGELYLLDPTAENYNSSSKGGTYIRSNEGLLTFQGMRPDTGGGAGINFTIDQVNTRIGVASSTPKASLSVDNTLTHDSFAVNDEASDASPFVITATGAVGIGTSSPRTKVEIATPSSGEIRMQVSGVGGESYFTRIQNNFNSANRFNFLNGDIAFFGMMSANYGSGAEQSTYMGGYGGISFVTNQSGAYSADNTVAVISRNPARMGIGTTSPKAKLDVVGSLNFQTPLFQLSRLTGTAANPATTTHFIVEYDGFTGISTTSPFAKLSVQGVAGETSPLFSVATSTPTASTTVFSINRKGHILTGGQNPTLSGCGTGATVYGNDQSGYVSVGTGSVVACVITFSRPYDSTPSCYADSDQLLTDRIVVASTSVTYATGLTSIGGTGAIIHYGCTQPI